MPSNQDFYIKLGIGLSIMIMVTFLSAAGLINDPVIAIILPSMMNFILGLYSSRD